MKTLEEKITDYKQDKSDEEDDKEVVETSEVNQEQTPYIAVEVKKEQEQVENEQLIAQQIQTPK
jgi:hypothetical protein